LTGAAANRGPPEPTQQVTLEETADRKGKTMRKRKNITSNAEEQDQLELALNTRLS